MFIRIIFPDGESVELLNCSKEQIADLLSAKLCKTYNLVRVDLAIYHCGQIRDLAALSMFENMVKNRNVPVTVKLRAGRCIEVRGTLGLAEAAEGIELFIDNVLTGETLKR